MNQPPDNNFYNDSTENTGSPWQQRPGQAPGYPQRPQAGPGNYAPQGPVSQPGIGQQNFPPGQLNFPAGPGAPNYAPQGPVSQPGQAQPNFPAGPGAPQGPMSQPGQPNFPAGPGAPQGPMSQPGQPNFPAGPGAPQGPVSQPGLAQPNFPPGQQAFSAGPGPQGPGGQPGPAQPNFRQGPVSQPGPGPQNFPPGPQGFAPGPGPQNFSPSGPVSQPGIGEQGYQQRFVSQPGIGPQRGEDQGDRTLNATSSLNAWDQGGSGPAPRSFAARELSDPSTPDQSQQRPSFPPPSGPVSQPGFSGVNRPQKDLYATEQAPSSTLNSLAGTAAPSWPPASPPESPTSFAPWQPEPPKTAPAGWSQPLQQSSTWQQPPQPQPPSNWQPQPPQQPPAWQPPPQQNPAWQPPAAPANWPNQAPLPGPPPAPTSKPKSRRGLVIALVLVALVIVGGASGLFYLRSHGSTPPAGTPGAHGTSTTNGVTPVPTHTAGTTPVPGGVGSIGTPSQAGTQWIATINSVKETSTSLIAPNAGNIYLEINLTLKNVSGKTLTVISILEFTLTSPDGKQRWHETLGDTNIRHTPDGNVSANSTLTAQMSYEVPKSQHAFVLIFAYGLNNNTSDSISWQLNV